MNFLHVYDTLKMKEGINMQYLTTLFWGFILGHVCFYLGSSLTQAPYSFIQGSILGFAITIATYIVGYIMSKANESTPKVEDDGSLHS